MPPSHLFFLRSCAVQDYCPVPSLVAYGYDWAKKVCPMDTSNGDDYNSGAGYYCGTRSLPNPGTNADPCGACIGALCQWLSVGPLAFGTPSGCFYEPGAGTSSKFSYALVYNTSYLVSSNRNLAKPCAAAPLTPTKTPTASTSFGYSYTSTASPYPTMTPQVPDPGPGARGDGLDGGSIAGIAVGSVAFVALLAGLGAMFSKGCGSSAPTAPAPSASAPPEKPSSNVPKSQRGKVTPDPAPVSQAPQKTAAQSTAEFNNRMANEKAEKDAAAEEARRVQREKNAEKAAADAAKAAEAKAAAEKAKQKPSLLNGQSIGEAIINKIVGK